MVSKLTPPRAIWTMVPAAFTEDTIFKLADLVGDKDVLIDGGNSYYRDDISRAETSSRAGSTTSTSGPAAGSTGSSAATA